MNTFNKTISSTLGSQQGSSPDLRPSSSCSPALKVEGINLKLWVRARARSGPSIIEWTALCMWGGVLQWQEPSPRPPLAPFTKFNGRFVPLVLKNSRFLARAQAAAARVPHCHLSGLLPPDEELFPFIPTGSELRSVSSSFFV